MLLRDISLSSYPCWLTWMKIMSGKVNFNWYWNLWHRTKWRCCLGIKKRCREGHMPAQKKSFSFPLIILKTHLHRSWIPAVFCVGEKFWKLFIWISCWVFSSRLFPKLLLCESRKRIAVKELKIENESRNERVEILNSGRQWMNLNIVTFVASEILSCFHITHLSLASNVTDERMGVKNDEALATL